ncbi:type 2 isopentenyl-diphosphate Delta-isomerase [Microaceticoccus formicicus]|uniref:type 2 isopentenyl-diphosphate Delta-isomerase n=1 Tax=Microaceticoccus formicicus TaxID=3118105 RepID=UPI003CD0160C|nr:type 2 isopentenyl-diphosphate Delta-isomerase [Peptoniphilaceae bacterium AMB_02]
MRKTRKTEHIENYLKTEYVGDNLFDYVILEHNSLPNLSFDEIDTSSEFLGKAIEFPLLINSMTGGADISLEINRDLAKIAKEFGIPMAVGSQQIVLDEEDTSESFKTVNEFLKEEDIIIGNLNASSSVENIIKAREIINADAMQLHLNPCQELVMEDGDRNFKGILDNIEKAVNNLDFPIIVKEVGFGISYDAAKKLYNAGVRYIDISGCGGTNFIEIENLRRNDIDFSDLYSWGNPTAKLLHEYRKFPEDLVIIASGGIRTGLDIVKALVMGADMVGVSGEVLNYLIHGGFDYARDYLEGIIYKTKIVMMLLGCKNLEELKKVPYKTVGRLKDLLY